MRVNAESKPHVSGKQGMPLNGKDGQKQTQPGSNRNGDPHKVAVRLRCTCGTEVRGRTITLCPSCVQLKVMTPQELKKVDSLILTDDDLAEKKYRRRLARRKGLKHDQ